MYGKNKIWQGVFGIFFLNRFMVSLAYEYEFIFDNDNIFDKCNDIPGNDGINDIFDMSGVVIEYTDGSIHAQGEMLQIWKTNPTDRVELRAELFKLQRGVWQPTMLSLNLRDFCKDQFKSGSIWYTAWSEHIKAEDQKCLNNYLHTYHYEPFDIDATISLSGNMEGRHKIRITMEALDKNNVKNPVSICLEIYGELLRKK